MFTIILKYLNISIPPESEFLVVFSFNIFILLLILLFSFLNILGYFISIILLNKYEIVLKYPKLKRIIQMYEKTSMIFLVFEIILVLIIILFLLYFTYLTFKNNII